MALAKLIVSIIGIAIYLAVSPIMPSDDTILICFCILLAGYISHVDFVEEKNEQ